MEFRQALPIGFILAGDYRIVDVLGQGGFGLTYKAEDTRLGSPVAIKEYFPSDLALRDESATVRARSSRDEGVFDWGRDKFLDEARTLARFRHPNIVRVSRLFEDNNTAYMVLDFEGGPSLSQWRERLRRPPTQAELDLVADKLLGAVEAVHDAGILHRDIKPGNVIMRDGIEPILIDFGAARQALSARSKTVHAIVTPGYSPKEQYALDVDRQGAWSDIYALGATFYYLLTGKTPADALSRDLDESMPMTTDGRETYRQSFLDAVEHAMSVRAEERPQSIADLRRLMQLPTEAPQIAPRPQPRSGRPGVPQQASRPVPASTRTPISGPRSTAARSVPPASGRNISFDQLPNALSQQPPPKRGLATFGTIASALAIGGLGYFLLVLGPQRDEAAWRVAVSTNSAESFEDYLRRYPNGLHAERARELRTARQSELRTAAAQPQRPVVSPPAPAPSPAPAPVPALPPPIQPPPVAQPQPAPATPPAPAPQPSLPPVAAAPSPAPAPSAPIAPPPIAPPAEPIRPIAPEANPPPGAPGAEDDDTTSATPATPAATAPPSPPRRPERRVTPLPERRALPPALAQSDLQRLASNVAQANWRLALFSTSQVTGFSEQPNTFAEELGRLSGNRLTLSVLSGANDTRTADFTRNIRANAELFAWHSPIQSVSRNRTYGIFAGIIPFGLAPADHVRWLRAEGSHLLEQLYRRDGFDIRLIPCGIGGQVGAWFKRELRNPSDIRGLKVRGMLFSTELMQRLGAAPVTVTTNEIPASFRNNALDAVFAATPQTRLFLRAPLPAPVYHFPSFHSPSFLMELMIPSVAWQQMSEPQRQLVDEACRRNLDNWASRFATTQNDILAQIRAQRVSVRPFTAPVLDALRRAATEVLNDEASKNTDFRDVLESYNRFRR